ncbi:hypothetical protein BJ742DRAFT_264704 [Cladochytrium replicatum]|nr:hypothetical protein BJ742DRAFT_264704 [Cladochytrium replicatum]
MPQSAEKVKRAKTKATTDKKIKAVSGATGKRKNSDAQSEDGEYNAAILRILEASKKSVREPYGELSDFYVEQTMLVEEDDLPASDELDPEGFFSTPILPRPHSDDNERSAWTGYSRPYIARSMLGDRFVLHSYDVDYNASDPDDEDIQEISQLFDFAQASSDWDDRLQRQTIPNSLFLDERDHEGRTVLTRWSTPIVGSGSTYLRYRQGLHTRIQGWNAGPQVVSTLSPHGHQHASWNYSTFYPNHHHVHRHRRQHYSVYSSYGELPQAQRTSTGVGSHYVEGNQSPPFLHRNHTNQFSPIQSQALLHSSGITTLNGSLNSMELSQSMQPTSSCESLLATHRHDYAVETQPQRFKRTSSGRAQEKFLGYFSPLSGSSGNISLHGSGSSSESFGHEKEARTPPSALNVPEGGVSPPLVNLAPLQLVATAFSAVDGAQQVLRPHTRPRIPHYNCSHLSGLLEKERPCIPFFGKLITSLGIEELLFG